MLGYPKGPILNPHMALSDPIFSARTPPIEDRCDWLFRREYQEQMYCRRYRYREEDGVRPEALSAAIGLQKSTRAQV